MATIAYCARSALHQFDLYPLLDEASGNISVPVRLGTQKELFLLIIHSYEAKGEALIETEICPVLPQARSETALTLAELNSRYSFVTFSLHDNRVIADTCVEFAFCSNIQELIALSLLRFFAVIEDAAPHIRAIAHPKEDYALNPTLKQQLEQLLDQQDDNDVLR